MRLTTIGRSQLQQFSFWRLCAAGVFCVMERERVWATFRQVSRNAASHSVLLEMADRQFENCCLADAERSVEMQFNQGASLITVDGKDAGHIDRVVIDPKTNEITHLVIRRGLLQKVDKVVPITAVTSGREGELTLHLKSDKWEFLPDFEEERYIL